MLRSLSWHVVLSAVLWQHSLLLCHTCHVKTDLLARDGKGRPRRGYIDAVRVRVKEYSDHREKVLVREIAQETGAIEGSNSA